MTKKDETDVKSAVARRHAAPASVPAPLFSRDGEPSANGQPGPASSGLLLSALLGHWSLGLLVLGPGGRILDANLTACGQLGCRSVATLVGRPLESLIHPDDRGWSAVRIGELLTDSVASTREELTVQTLDGRSMPVELHLSSLAGESIGTRYVIVVMEGIEDRRRHENELRRLAETDPLTGLFNVRQFTLELERHLQRCRRYGPQGALMVVDVDGLKAVNDAHGHAAGDAALRATAKLLTDRLRSSDVIGRIGGDEFAVLLPNAYAEDAARVAASLRTRSAAIDELHSSLGLSIGIALIDSELLATDALMQAADGAMYAAKHAGGRQFAFAPGAASAVDKNSSA